MKTKRLSLIGGHKYVAVIVKQEKAQKETKRLNEKEFK